MRTQKSFLNLLLFLFLFSSCSINELNSHKDNLYPNIIYILADDLGYGDVNCLNPDSKIRTPNIDKLASQGITFTDAHSSSSLCSPTRYGILTGRYSWRSRRQGGALWKFDQPLIEENRLTVSQFLKNNGYYTACFGKWHLGMNWSDKNGEILQITGAEKGWNIDFTRPIKNGPITKGFDYYFGTDAPNYPPYCFIENDHTIGIPTIDKPDSMYGVPGIMLENWSLYDVLPEIEKRAIEYINERASKDDPFFLYFPLTAPHTPIVPTEEHIGKSQAGAYGDFVHQVDAIVGRIMTTLEENNLSDNTLIIFTSDNGSPRLDGTDMAGGNDSVLKYDHNPSYIFRGKKADIWEGGHRVPFFVKWPDKIKPGIETDELVCHTDFFATCAAIIGKSLPQNAGEDSFNILPILSGEKTTDKIRESIVHLGGNGSFSIREGKWKLEICPGSGGGGTLAAQTALQKGLPMIQLYDLSNDIREQNNQYHLYPDVVYNLTSLLKQYVDKGRSTPGSPQTNTGEPDIWRALNVRDLKYNINKVDHIAVGKTAKKLNDVQIKFSKNNIDVLTDGIRASSWFNDGYWVGVEGNDLDIIVDLGKKQNIKEVTVGFLEAQSYWIFHPLKIKFSISQNGENFSDHKIISRNSSIMNEGSVIEDFSVDYDNEYCRYVRIKVQNIKVCPEWHKGAGGKAWIFLDEIIIN